MQKISYVIPCYRSQHTVGGVVAEIAATMQTLPQYDYEVILVNDCSPDDTFGTIRGLVAADNHVVGVDLAKNFGQHAALMAGFHKCSGDIVVCLDDDGQTPADEVGKLLAKIDEGYDVVYASYDTKRQAGWRNLGSWVNSKMTEIMLGKPPELVVNSYFAARRFIVDEMLRYEHCYPYVIGLVLRSTKRICNVPVHHRAREEGRSGYTLSKLLNLWMNGFTSFSVKPLRIATYIGTLFAVAGFLYFIYIIIDHFTRAAAPIGWASTTALLLLLGGMPMFDAICVSLGTAGTGGFGNWNNSIAHYDSAYLQNVISVFMILFGINFNAYFLLLTRKFKQLFKIEEIRVYLGVIAVFTTLIAFNVRGCFGSLRESFHHSLFQVASIITTTGFSTVDFNQWPAFSKLLLVLLMFIGACAGSTGGGMKCSRILLLFKGVKKEMMSLIHPRLVRVHKMDGQRVQHEVMRSVNAFLVAYLIVIATSVLIVSLHCEDMVTSFTSVVTCINNVGPGLNQVGPAANFGALHPLSKIVLTFDMLAGRLELFPMLLLFSPRTWMKE